jgi:hypothetical protein
VRLDPDRQRKVRALRERGVALSDLVREAIDRRFEQLAGATRPIDVRRRLDEILAAHPDPVNQAPHEYDPHDRKQVRAAVAQRLRRRRRHDVGQ